MSAFDAKNRKGPREGYDRSRENSEDSFNRDDSGSYDPQTRGNRAGEYGKDRHGGNPKNSQGFGNRENYGNRGGYSNRDNAGDSRGRNEGASPYLKDKRPRIQRPADTEPARERDYNRYNKDEQTGQRRSFNPNFSRDNRRNDQDSNRSGYRPRSGDERNSGRDYSRSDSDRPRRYESNSYPGGDSRREGAEKPWHKEGGNREYRREDSNRDYNRGRDFNREQSGYESRERSGYDREKGYSREQRPQERGYNPDRGYNREQRPQERGYSQDRGYNREQRPQERSYNPDRGYNRERSGSERGGAPRSGFRSEPGRSFSKGPARNKPFNKKGPRHEYTRENYPRFEAPKAIGAVRLNRFIANSGICSRREADDYIQAGVVTINGKVVTELGTKVMPGDEVRFNDSLIRGEKKVYIVMNKPKGFVTSMDDPHAEKTVMDLLKNACDERVYPVGRLDKNSVGVLLITNDGELTRQLTHPGFQKKKIYQVALDKPLTKADMEQIAQGIELEDGMIHADEISYVNDNKREIGIEIHSGRNRIIRRIFEALGYSVQKLDRVYFAGLTKKGLKRGAWRYLNPREVSMLVGGGYE